MEELIDVLDENGNKTGEIVTRTQIHKEGLWHKIVVIAIIDKEGRLLMQQRAKDKTKNPLKWDVSSAGHVSSNQTSIESAIRETQEELGIEVNEKELQYILTYKDNVKIDEDYIDNQIYDCYIVKKEDIQSLRWLTENLSYDNSDLKMAIEAANRKGNVSAVSLLMNLSGSQEKVGRRRFVL